MTRSFGDLLSQSLRKLRPASKIIATSLTNLTKTKVAQSPTFATPDYLTSRLPFATFTSDTNKSSALKEPSSLHATNFKKQFSLAKEELLETFEELLKESGLDRSSIEAGHKIIAFRSTILSRIWLDLYAEFNDPLEENKIKIGEAALAKKIAQNEFYIRFTMHPTEGQNLPTILGKDIIIKITSIISKINLLDELGGDDKMFTELVGDLIEITKTHNVKNDFIDFIIESKTIPAKEEFLSVAKEIRKGFIRDFIEKPINHIKKMSVETEKAILLHHLSRCRKESALIAAKHPELVEMDNMKFSTWGCDLDGKPHVKPSHGVTLEYEGQKVFFEDLLTMLESFKISLDLAGFDSGEFVSKVIAPISEISKSERLFLGEEGKNNEKIILEILDSFAKTNDVGSQLSFARIKNYVTSSGCRVAENMSSTREEIDKTIKAFDEIAEICLKDNPELQEQIKKEFGEDVNLAQYFLDNAANPKITKTLAENFSKLSEESKRQIMFQMESAIIHHRHEHIISQFDCNLESYKKTLALFEICKYLPQYHEAVPHFAKYYSEVGKSLDFDLYNQLFSSAAIEAAASSMVELSPLAEDKETIPLLINFTKEFLADEQITNYIRKAGGIVRQTRSNSDGSSSLGPQRVSYEYLKADIAIKRMTEEAGFKLEILSGIGANDIERMAPWTLDLLHQQFTAQGGDAQHQTASRLMHMLLKDPVNKSEILLEELEEKYGEEVVRNLANFYCKLHLESEEGFEVEIDEKPAKTGHMTSRGSIAGKVVEFLGKLSSRPDSRKGDVGSETIIPNDFDRWHDSVYNPQMRRIGAISLQRISGVATFLTAPFACLPTEFDKKFVAKLVADFNKIPAIRNTNLSAIFALGVADIDSFLLANGFPEEISSRAIEEYADQYKEFLGFNPKDSDLAKECAAKHGFKTPSGIRAGHLSNQINNLKFVLRNAITPLASSCSKETIDALEEVFTKSEKGGAVKEYNELVAKACETLIKDPSIDVETKETLTCIVQQISNVRRPGNYYDTRKKLISDAHKASQSNDKEGLFLACDQLATITRSAGNPISPGRKTHEMLDYFRDSFGKLAVDLPYKRMPVEVDLGITEDLSRC